MKYFPPWVCSLDWTRGVNSAYIMWETIILIVLKGIPEWEPFFDLGHSANCLISVKTVSESINLFLYLGT